jgi:hypothetical protein
MLATLVVALSLAAPAAAIDVPFLPQTEALCGGAAAAMVFRFWGDAHADVQEFAALVDRRAGGIASDVLADAVRRRGWRTGHVEPSVAALQARVRAGQPVIVLVPDRGNRYHYVVVTGVGEAAVVVHDPSWGPSRTIPIAAFERAWRAARYWSMLVLPPADGVASGSRAAVLVTPADEVRPTGATACDEQLNRALVEGRERGLDRAATLLDAIRAECPAAAGPLRELSGVRFAQHRYDDAAALARQALALEGGDAYALDVLGSSLFMQDDAAGALRAWNQIDRPRVNLVRVEGVRRTRHQTIAEVLGIRPNMLLDAETFARARRRLNELPDHSTARLSVRPESDGFATVDVAISERETVPRGRFEWIGAGVRAGVNREVAVAVPGLNGQGSMWSARWSWWERRPGVSIAFAAPHVRGLPGVWRVDGSWQEETYARDRSADAASLVRESRTRGAVTMSDWLTSNVRYELSSGLDAWSGGRKAASFGGAIERRALRDRVAVSVDATRWLPMTSAKAFQSAGARMAVRSSTDLRGWVYRGATGATRASDAAPYALWPGAGEGHARAPLLRAHPLLRDGVVDLSESAAFGRAIWYGTAEAQRWLDRAAPLRIAFAGFVDVARATRRATPGRDAVQTDVGVGWRVKVPGSAGMLRVDIGHGLRDGSDALTVGWISSSF